MASNRSSGIMGLRPKGGATFGQVENAQWPLLKQYWQRTIRQSSMQNMNGLRLKYSENRILKKFSYKVYVKLISP